MILLPRAVSSEKIGEYLRLRFEGHSNSQASSRMGFSSRTGTNHLKNIREEARREGLLSVASSYGLEIDDLFKLGGELKKNDLSVERCNVGLFIAAVLARLNVDLSKFDNFVKDVFLEALNQGISNDELAITLAEFSLVRRENGLNYRQANENYKDLLAKKQRLEVEGLDIENQVKSLKHKLLEEMKEERITREELGNFTDTRDTLKRIGVPVDDYKKLPTLFQNVKDLDYEPKAVASLFSTHTNLSVQKKELSDTVQALTDEQTKLSEDNKKLEEIVTEKKLFVKSLRLLEEQNLSPEYTRVLTEAIAAIGTKSGLTSMESIDRFTAEVNDHFYPLLSLREEESRRKNNVDSLNLQKDELQGDLEIQSDVYNSRRKVLDVLKTLNQAGVLDKDLIIWKSILQKQGMDPTELRLGIERMGDLESIVESKSDEVRDLEDKCAQLNRVHDQLESSLTSLTSNTVNEVKDNLGRFKKILDDFDEQFLSEETGFNAETKKILSTAMYRIETMMRTTEASWDDKMNDLSKQLGSVVQEVAETRDLAYETGREVGQYSTINVLSKLLRGELIERNEAVSGMHILTTCMQSWASHNKENELSISCSNISSQLARMMARV
jgi:hypothetical protein